MYSLWLMNLSPLCQGETHHPHCKTTIQHGSPCQSYGRRGTSTIQLSNTVFQMSSLLFAHLSICNVEACDSDVKLPLTFAWNCLFQPINFPGLDENEAAHFLCGLQRLNRIAEVQTWWRRAAVWYYFTSQLNYCHSLFIWCFLGQCQQSPSPGWCRVHLHEPRTLPCNHGDDEEV